MEFHESSDEIKNRISHLRTIRDLGGGALIYMRRNPEIGTSHQYSGEITDIVDDEDPYICMRVGRITLLTSTPDSIYRNKLFDAMRKMREKAQPSQDSVEQLAADLQLFRSLDETFGEAEDQTIEIICDEGTFVTLQISDIEAAMNYTQTGQQD